MELNFDLKKDIAQRKEVMWQAAQLAACSAAKEVVEGIVEMAKSDAALSARWILVHIDYRRCMVEVDFAVHDYEIYRSKNDLFFDIFEIAGAKGQNDIFKMHYRKALFKRLKKELAELGFINIETETPYEEKDDHSDEMFEWYALELD